MHDYTMPPYAPYLDSPDSFLIEASLDTDVHHSLCHNSGDESLHSSYLPTESGSTIDFNNNFERPLVSAACHYADLVSSDGPHGTGPLPQDNLDAQTYTPCVYHTHPTHPPPCRLVGNEDPFFDHTPSGLAMGFIVALLPFMSDTDLCDVLRAVCEALQLPEPPFMTLLEASVTPPSFDSSPESSWSTTQLIVPMDPGPCTSPGPAQLPGAPPYSIHLDEKGVKWYSCDVCEKYIKEHHGPDNFWEHYNTHDPNRERFSCPWPECVCKSRAYSRERDLKRHISEEHLGTALGHIEPGYVTPSAGPSLDWPMN